MGAHRGLPSMLLLMTMPAWIDCQRGPAGDHHLEMASFPWAGDLQLLHEQAEPLLSGREPQESHRVPADQEPEEGRWDQVLLPDLDSSPEEVGRVAEHHGDAAHRDGVGAQHDHDNLEAGDHEDHRGPTGDRRPTYRAGGRREPGGSHPDDRRPGADRLSHPEKGREAKERGSQSRVSSSLPRGGAAVPPETWGAPRRHPSMNGISSRGSPKESEADYAEVGQNQHSVNCKPDLEDRGLVYASLTLSDPASRKSPGNSPFPDPREPEMLYTAVRGQVRGPRAADPLQ
ncbi:uncharacterized protein LOC103166315 isoform X1 [Ornithorhynchus anatinus]|uniref:uncharacterized protein LOC103166315 isoform X1 n=1 Tax=Ornithorhynchus anatinus TaxID=9258 RepID=UPI0010A75C21|nr:uncharacterized protein LOC103166315 isoform X1 [Ornithorhynchus anatinus]